MSVAKIAITINKTLLSQIDRMVHDHTYPTRSKAFQDAISEKIVRDKRTRLANECNKLDAKKEQTMAEEGLLSEVSQWPEY